MWISSFPRDGWTDLFLVENLSIAMRVLVNLAKDRGFIHTAEVVRVFKDQFSSYFKLSISRIRQMILFRWLNLTMRHIQVTVAHYQSARNLHHDACYMLIAHSHSWGDFSKIILLLIIKLSSQVVELDDATYSKYTGRLPKCKRPVLWFLSTNIPQFLLKKHLQCSSKYTPTRAKSPCSVYCCVSRELEQCPAR